MLLRKFFFDFKALKYKGFQGKRFAKIDKKIRKVRKIAKNVV